jgi:hypothetical protein
MEAPLTSRARSKPAYALDAEIVVTGQHAYIWPVTAQALIQSNEQPDRKHHMNAVSLQR